MQTSEAKTVHDWLLKHKPEEVDHAPESCKLCTSNASTQEEQVAEDKKEIFTQEQHEQLLAAAVEKGIAEATSKMDGEVLHLNEQVEALQKDIESRDATIADLEKAQTEREENDRLAALATERAGKVKEKANFTDEQLEARKDGWAKMSDEDFEAYLEDIETVAKASTSSDAPKTVFEGVRETATGGTEMSAIKAFLSNENLANVGSD